MQFLLPPPQRHTAPERGGALRPRVDPQRDGGDAKALRNAGGAARAPGRMQQLRARHGRGKERECSSRWSCRAQTVCCCCSFTARGLTDSMSRCRCSSPVTRSEATRSAASSCCCCFCPTRRRRAACRRSRSAGKACWEMKCLDGCAVWLRPPSCCRLCGAWPGSARIRSARCPPSSSPTAGGDVVCHHGDCEHLRTAVIGWLVDDVNTDS